ncbi:MAG: hypothetical protein DRI48_07025 [Chloroflexi bacterium]|nr:MAG: hypothetical protein DRI48_07025 [Chloroflexota bacterium]
MAQESSSPRRIWLTLQAEEIVELKQLMMDRDVEGTSAFFHQIVFPRVQRAAERRGISADVPFKGDKRS